MCFADRRNVDDLTAHSLDQGHVLIFGIHNKEFCIGIPQIHSTVFIYPTILGRQAHAVKQNAIQHLGIGRNIPEPLVREQHLRNSIECE